MTSGLDISSREATGNVPVPRFTAELKAKWIEALRSGKYEQCKGALHNGSEFCCLGVYGELNGISRKLLETHCRLLGSLQGEITGLEPLDALNNSVKRKLASMNDLGKSFTEIADHIETDIPAEE